MREFCHQHLLYSPHALSDHRSEAFRVKMIRYFQSSGSDSGIVLWNGTQCVPHNNENAQPLLNKALRQ
jgi:hypothetical protein